MSDNKDVQNAEEQKSYCEDVIKETDGYIEQVESLSPELAENLRSLRDKGCEVIDNVANVEVAGTTLGEMATGPTAGFVGDVIKGEDVTEAAIDNFAGDAIDEFLENYGNYGGELVNISYTQSFPLVGVLNADVNFGANASATLRSSRDGATVTCTGKASASGTLGFGASCGVNLVGYDFRLFYPFRQHLRLFI